MFSQNCHCSVAYLFKWISCELRHVIVIYNTKKKKEKRKKKKVFKFSIHLHYKHLLAKIVMYKYCLVYSTKH